MSSSAIEPEAPDLVCQLDNVQGMVDAFSAVRWKRQQVWAQQKNQRVSGVIFFLLFSLPFTFLVAMAVGLFHCSIRTFYLSIIVTIRMLWWNYQSMALF